MGILYLNSWPEHHKHTTRIRSKSVSCMPNGYGQDGEIVPVIQKLTSLQEYKERAREMVSATEPSGNPVISQVTCVSLHSPLNWERDTLIRISHSRYRNSGEKMLNSCCDRRLVRARPGRENTPAPKTLAIGLECRSSCLAGRINWLFGRM